MNLTKQQLEHALIKELEKKKFFDTILPIVKKNTSGTIYLIGGAVSRTLANFIYGGKETNFDFDFVVENINDDLTIPSGWVFSDKKFGNPTFKNKEFEIDIFPLSDYAYIKNNNLLPSIENYLDGVPFSIQSLAFDLSNKKLIGEVGLKALFSKKIKVHNILSAKAVAKRKGTSINKRMLQKAKSMNFKIEIFNG